MQSEQFVFMEATYNMLLIFINNYLNDNMCYHVKQIPYPDTYQHT